MEETAVAASAPRAAAPVVAERRKAGRPWSQARAENAAPQARVVNGAPDAAADSVWNEF
jgi:hypothetical protein